MEVLEIKPVKNKEISVFMINKKDLTVNKEDIKRLTEIFRYIEVDFITIDLENERMRNFAKSSLPRLLESFKVPYYPLDIPEYAMGYLLEEIIQKENQLDEILEEFLTMRDKESFKGLNLKSWIDVLKNEIEEKKKFLSLNLRPQWIVKKILDIIRSCNKQEITFVHLSQEDIFTETMKLLKELKFEVYVQGSLKTTKVYNVITNTEEIAQWKC
ncbi:MAG: hypothetical protein ACTSPD_14565 [Promethearchaeota archaeon]